MRCYYACSDVQHHNVEWYCLYVMLKQIPTFSFSLRWKASTEPVNSRFQQLYIKHHSVFMSNVHEQVIQIAVLLNSWQQPFIVVTCHNAYVKNPTLFPLETGISFATFGIQERAALWKSLTDYRSFFSPPPPLFSLFASSAFASFHRVYSTRRCQNIINMNKS